MLYMLYDKEGYLCNQRIPLDTLWFPVPVFAFPLERFVLDISFYT